MRGVFVTFYYGWLDALDFWLGYGLHAYRLDRMGIGMDHGGCEWGCRGIRLIFASIRDPVVTACESFGIHKILTPPKHFPSFILFFLSSRLLYVSIERSAL